MDQDLKKIINNYGVIPQLKYFQSEVFELTEAILEKEKQGTLERCISGFSDAMNKIFGNKSTDLYIAHITEEIADVLVMIKQLQYYYNISEEDIESVMKYKIDRQIERIKKEKSTNKGE